MSQIYKKVQNLNVPPHNSYRSYRVHAGNKQKKKKNREIKAKEKKEKHLQVSIGLVFLAL